MAQQQQQILTLEQVPQFLIVLGEKIDRMEKTLATITDGGPSKDLLNIDEAAAMLSLAKQTLYCHVSNPKGADPIPFQKKGNRLYFSRSKLLDWIERGNLNKQPVKQSRKPKQVVKHTANVRTHNPDMPF